MVDGPDTERRINVLVTAPIEPADLESIAAVDHSVRVTDAMEQVRSELDLKQDAFIPWARPLAPTHMPRGEASRELDQLLAEAEVIFAWRLPLNLVARAPLLKWVHGVGAGIDLVAGRSGILESDVTFTNSVGTYGVPIAETVIWFMLSLAKKANRHATNKLSHRWERTEFAPRLLHGKTIGIVGLGDIGRRVAELARAFDMKVLATRRSAIEHALNTDGVDELFPPGQLENMLGLCDYLVLAVPLTPETKGMIGEAQLKAMKSSAYIINVARGTVIDEPALIKALKEKWIAGAGLDVFATEPLSPTSPLWDIPNIVLTPHIAGAREGQSALLTDLFCQNLRHYLAGEQLLNVVDKSRAY